MSQRTTPPPGAAGDNQPASAAAKLFDLRVLIGALFSFYGVVLIVAGLVAGEAALRKASGVNINLWMGIGMLVLGLLFLLWWRLRPLRPVAEPEPTRTAARTRRPDVRSTPRRRRR